MFLSLPGLPHRPLGPPPCAGGGGWAHHQVGRFGREGLAPVASRELTWWSVTSRVQRPLLHLLTSFYRCLASATLLRPLWQHPQCQLLRLRIPPLLLVLLILLVLLLTRQLRRVVHI